MGNIYIQYDYWVVYIYTLNSNILIYGSLLPTSLFWMHSWTSIGFMMTNRRHPKMTISNGHSRLSEGSTLGGLVGQCLFFFSDVSGTTGNVHD